MVKHCFNFDYLHWAWLETKQKGLSFVFQQREFWVVECEIAKTYLLQQIFSQCAKASGHLINHKNWTDKLGPQLNLHKIVSDSTEASKESEFILMPTNYIWRITSRVYYK